MRRRSRRHKEAWARCNGTSLAAKMPLQRVWQTSFCLATVRVVVEREEVRERKTSPRPRLLSKLGIGRLREETIDSVGVLIFPAGREQGRGLARLTGASDGPK